MCTCIKEGKKTTGALHKWAWGLASWEGTEDLSQGEGVGQHLTQQGGLKNFDKGDRGGSTDKLLLKFQRRANFFIIFAGEY